MSGLIKNLKEEVGSEKENSEKITTINLPIRVLSYEDNKFVIGQRVDTGETVKVFLRDVEQKGKYERIGIDKLSAQNGKYVVAAGDPASIVMFEGAYQEEDGTWNARWIKILSNKKWPAKVFCFPSSVYLVNYNDNKFLCVNVVKKVHRLEDKNQESLKRMVVDGLRPKMLKMNPVVAVRFTDSIGDSIVHHFYPKKEVVNENKQLQPPHQYIEELWGKERFQKLLTASNDPEIKIDVMFITQMNFGADTNEKIIGNNFEMTKIKEEYSTSNGDRLYKNTVLSLRERDDTSMFLIAAAAIQNGEKGVSIEDL